MGKPLALQERLTDEALLAYRSPWWLRSKYGADTLVADFGTSGVVTLDMSIHCGGKPLSSPDRTTLRLEIYDFLCIQAHPDCWRGRQRNPKTEREHFMRAVRIVDYYLLNDSLVGLSSAGFAGLAPQHLTQFLVDLASSPWTAEGIYGWTERLRHYLLAGIKELIPREYKRTRRRLPALNNFELAETDWSLGLAKKEVLRARVFLYSKGFYRAASPSRGWRLVPNGRAISRELFNHTLLGRAGHFGAPAPIPELCLQASDHYFREREGVPVKHAFNDERTCEPVFNQYFDTLMTWNRLAEHGIGVPLDSLQALNRNSIRKVLPLKPVGGMVAVPPPVVAFALRAAIEFAYEHGAHLLASLSAVLNQAKAQAVRPIDIDSKIPALLCEATNRFGVYCWSLDDHLFSAEGVQSDGREFLAHLRARRMGLYDAVRILYGAYFIILGSLQAARHGELLDITSDSVDGSGKWLALLSRKTGFADTRFEDWRPLAKAAADVLASTAHLHDMLRIERGPLLSVPGWGGTLSAVPDSANRSIDMFLDYIDSPTDAEGRRYYIREHQLRQFFAAAFFHCCSFAAPDVLRWFLRQLDARQLYAYICTSVSAAHLKRYKAVAAAGLMRGGSSATVTLSSFLQRHLGVSTFDVMSDNELAEYLSDLQSDGSVSIEPIFGPGGDLLRLGVSIWKEVT